MNIELKYDKLLDTFKINKPSFLSIIYVQSKIVFSIKTLVKVKILIKYDKVILVQLFQNQMANSIYKIRW